MQPIKIEDFTPQVQPTKYSILDDIVTSYKNFKLYKKDSNENEISYTVHIRSPVDGVFNTACDDQ